ncbi:ATP-binding protein [Streptomyces lanatus]|uniref:Tetratricopeptide repeat protein n=1 Tax=Streptomyces lanatus TaxID=66900 RepID=A0ABV1XUE2_9ACTN|nr:tetratricopeptide repeat protein [Streptomyces lanatus]GHH11752.1 hypothetical protein GCM10018780_49720 [Streptomyces lanatus]
MDVIPETPPAMAGLPVRTAADLIGREAQLGELLDLLNPSRASQHQGPLSAVVTGLAGVGKTELVLHVAAQAHSERGWFPGGVLFVDVFGYDRDLRLSPDRVLGTWLRALGVADADIPADPLARVALYRSVLSAHAERGRRVLVVIDNASHADQVTPLLPGDGHNAALITSRHTLDVGALLCDLDVLAPDAAVALIRGTLQHSRGPHDTRVDDEPGPAARIAEYCGRLPLALQICAALLADTPTRPLDSLAESLADAHRRLDHLTREDRAVRAAFDLSHRHLERVSPAHARLFRLLPLNPGPEFATPGAARLCDTDEARTGIMLQDLARAHLVEPARTWGRWRQHDLVRLYADELGRARTDADQSEAALGRLLEYYAGTAAAADTHLVDRPGQSPAPSFRDRSEAMSWLDAELPNLLGAAAFATGQGHPHVTMALAASLTEFCALRLHFMEMTLLAAVALPAHRLVGDIAGEGGAQFLLGISVLLPGRPQEAVEPFRTAAALFREAGAGQGEARALSFLAIALSAAGHPAEAEEAHQRSLAVHRETGDRGGEGRATGAHALRLAERGEHDQALLSLREGLSICREAGDRFGEGRLLGMIGMVQGRAGREEQGVKSLEQAAAVFRELGERRVEGEILGDLGEALTRMGRLTQAVPALEAAAACFEETGNRLGKRRLLAALGTARLGLGRNDEAVDALREAIACEHEYDDEHQAVLLDGLGAALLATGHYEEAVDRLRQSLASSREAGDRDLEAESLNRLGLALGRTGRGEDASAAFRQAIALFRSFGDGAREAIALTNFGAHLLASGRPDEALPQLHQALALCEETGDDSTEPVATRLLTEARRRTRRTGPAR